MPILPSKVTHRAKLAAVLYRWPNICSRTFKNYYNCKTNLEKKGVDF